MRHKSEISRSLPNYVNIKHWQIVNLFLRWIFACFGKVQVDLSCLGFKMFDRIPEFLVDILELSDLRSHGIRPLLSGAEYQGTWGKHSTQLIHLYFFYPR